jgi:putative hemolysin
MFGEVAHCPGCAALATLQAENADWKRQLDETRNYYVAFQSMHHARVTTLEAERDEARGTAALFSDHLLISDQRATAAEGERDRLRELLERALASLAFTADYAEEHFVPAGGIRAFINEAKDALAATPHTEGEASAPPTDEVKRG